MLRANPPYDQVALLGSYSWRSCFRNRSEGEAQAPPRNSQPKSGQAQPSGNQGAGQKFRSSPGAAEQWPRSSPAAQEQHRSSPGTAQKQPRNSSE